MEELGGPTSSTASENVNSIIDIERQPIDREEVEPDWEDSSTHTMTSSGMLNVDEGVDNRNAATRLKFIQTALSDTPYIQSSHGTDFANSFDPDYFPKTFPTLFPYGSGGPRGLLSVPTFCTHISSSTNSSLSSEGNSCADCVACYQPEANMTLKKWANLALNRHGGRFACHPIFCFLVFNMILRSNNNRISMIKMSPANYNRAQNIFQNLSPERLHQAAIELQKENQTSDLEVRRLLNELSLFFFSQPLSNESRLQMRKKINSICVQTGVTVVWFTVNPNDVTNPVKLRLAVYRDASSAAEAEKTLNDILTPSEFQRTVQSAAVMDPVSSVIFFQREIKRFFEHSVRAGEDSVFGHISHYYAAAETNNRGALHLHGLMWLEGNVDLPTLSKSMRNPEEEEYRNKVTTKVDDIFTESLDYAAGRAESRSRSLQAYGWCQESRPIGSICSRG